MTNIMRLVYLRIFLLCIISSFQAILCEIFSSVEQFSSWPVTSGQILKSIEENIRLEQKTLPKLQDTISSFADLTSKILQDKFEESNNEILTNPIAAYVNLNRIIGDLDELRQRLNDEYSQIRNYSHEVEVQYNKLRTILPDAEDLFGAGEAIIRLQKFYRLNTSDLVIGKLSIGEEHQDTRPGKRAKLTATECYQIGRIAYHNNDFKIAFEWFQKSLELFNKNEKTLGAPNEWFRKSLELFNANGESLEGLNYDENGIMDALLDYLAFAAYKTKRLAYAAEITKIWIERDPNNDRARSNLDYYVEEMEGFPDDPSEDLDKPQDENKSVKMDMASIYSLDSNHIDPGSYEVTDDNIVRDLCRGGQSHFSNQPKNNCFLVNKFAQIPSHPTIKVEVLSESPSIVRIHELITDEEAEQVRLLAVHNLERSTVHLKGNSISSQFRIAKTAWITSKGNQIVERIEERLSSVTGLHLQTSEHLQVVNYGLGGYYGPHIDSARKSKTPTEPTVGNMQEAEIPLMSNDRMATILIYLNKVDAGGATVFPRLNLTVEPIKNSGIVWYNLRENGFSDGRTLHSGCPVLLGTKWIATKWPRESPNIFLRPCGIEDQ